MSGAITHRKICTIVVDDEPLARSNVTMLLRRDPEVVIVGECGSGEEALKDIRERKPDLVFLDVQMPECDGFDVLELLGGDQPTAIIFVTAYDQYALRAFEAGALDYLLKPFDNARFERALERAKQKIAGSRGQHPKMDRLAIYNTGELTFVEATSIDWIEAADYYAALHVGPKTHLLRRSLSDLEQDLDPDLFCRIHRSTIINLQRVQGLKLAEDGEHTVQLKDGPSLRLSRRYKKELRARLRIECSS